MQWLTIIGIGIAANLDNLGIGLSYGIKSTRISITSNLIMSLIAITWGFIALTSGKYLQTDLKVPHISLIGGLLIIVVGAWNITSNLRQTLSNQQLTQIFQQPEIIDLDKNRLISWKESITLGMILAINCIGTGFGAGASGISPFWTTLSIGVFSFISIDLGVRSGLRLGQTWLAKKSTLLSGFILIAIGLYEIFF